MTDAVAARWNAGGTAVGASAQGYAETGCARAQRSATTGTPSQEMDAAGTAWWRRGSHAVEPGRTGSAGDLATRVWEDAAMARGRQGRRRSATTGTLWAGTDAAHHARSSAGGSVRGDHGQCGHMLGDVWRQGAGRGGGVRRREHRERRRVLIIVHDRGGVLVRALCGAAVSMRGVWGLVHARMRGRACGGEGGMGGGVLRRREP